MRINISGVIGEISTLPGCTQVAVSHGVFVPEEMRGKGLGKSANTIRQQEMKRLGYDYALCTVEDSNVAQKGVMYANEWKPLGDFLSRKTGHKVILFGKRL